MEFMSSCLLLTIFVILLTIYWFCQRDGQLPPCPVAPLPVVGHLFFLDTDFRRQYRKWRKQCGDIFSLYFGSKLLIVINGYELIQETLVKRGDDFTDRPVMVFDQLMGYEGQGIAFASGDVWEEQRRTALQIFRKFGLGKNVLADMVLEEVTHLLNHLASFDGHPVDIRTMTSMSTANIVCSILNGRRFEYSDPTFKKMMADIQKIIVNNQQNSMLVFCPMLQFFLKALPRYNVLVQNMKELYRQFQTFIDESKDKDPEDNFIAAYKNESEARLMAGESTSLSEENLLKVVADLFIAGSETTSTTICWFVLYMLNYPEVQERIFEEINQHVGTERAPTIQDRNKLTFLNASIMETQRLSSISPVSIVRTCSNDHVLNGYNIPKGSLITPNLDSVLLDEKIWGDDVKTYRPERFIDEEEQLRTPEEFIPFGLGRRICMGKSMAKTELFLYIACMMQKFRFIPVDKDQPPPMKYILGLTAVPENYLVKIVHRSKDDCVN